MVKEGAGEPAPVIANMRELLLFFIPPKLCAAVVRSTQSRNGFGITGRIAFLVF